MEVIPLCLCSVEEYPDVVALVDATVAVLGDSPEDDQEDCEGTLERVILEVLEGLEALEVLEVLPFLVLEDQVVLVVLHVHPNLAFLEVLVVPADLDNLLALVVLKVHLVLVVLADLRVLVSHCCLLVLD